MYTHVAGNKATFEHIESKLTIEVEPSPCVLLASQVGWALVHVSSILHVLLHRGNVHFIRDPPKLVVVTRIHQHLVVEFTISHLSPRVLRSLRGRSDQTSAADVLDSAHRHTPMGVSGCGREDFEEDYWWKSVTTKS